MSSARAASNATGGGTLPTPQKQPAALPLLPATAPVGHSRHAGTVLTLGWGRFIDGDTEAQTVEATHPKPHRRDLGFKPQLAEPRG